MKHAKVKQTFNVKTLWIVLGIVVGVLIIIYGVGAYFFSSHFGFRTSIDTIDCSYRTVAEVEQLISDQVDSYELTLEGRDNLRKTIQAPDVGLSYVPDGQVEEILRSQNHLLWFMRLFRDTGEATTHASVEYDSKKLTAAIKRLDLFNPKKMRLPVDAYAEFKAPIYVVHPEDLGSTLDERLTEQAIGSALNALAPELDLDQADCYVLPDVFSANPELNEQIQLYNAYVPFAITYTFGDEVELLDAKTTLEWIDIAEDGTGTLNEKALIAWARDFGLRHDTVGSKRTFKTNGGEEITVEGGTYGWEIDEEGEIEAIKAALANRTGEKRDPLYAQTAAEHTAPGTPEWGTTYIELDLTNQHMYYYVDGKQKFDAPVVTGSPWPSRATPPGVYRILQMLSPATLVGAIMADGQPEYRTRVSFWMRMTWAGHGFHDATWQPWFGGDRYTYAGSHGCINMSYTDAQTLYSLIEVGVPVVSHH
jgi:hypothetical protein